MTTNNRPELLGQYAGFISRGAALIIDIVIVSIAVIVIGWIISLPLTYFFSFDVQSCLDADVDRSALIVAFCFSLRIAGLLVILITAPLYFAALMSLNGQTIGKYVMGVRVVRVDGQRMTFFGCLWRWFGYFVSAILLGLGFLVVLVNDERRALHDRMAGTCVIYSWRARQNELLIDRVDRWMDQHGRDGKAETDDDDRDSKQPATKVRLSSLYELVVIAIPNYARLQTMLTLLENSVLSGEIEVINTAVMVKGIDGNMGVVGVSDLTNGESALRIVDEKLRVPQSRLDQIRADVPNDSFVVTILIRDEWLDAMLRIVSRRAPAMLAHYDVGDEPSTLTSADGFHPELVTMPTVDVGPDSGEQEG